MDKKITKWPYGHQISVRVIDEYKERLANAYTEIVGHDEKVPMNDFFYKIVDLAIDSLIIRDQLRDANAKLKQLEEKIELLENENSNSLELLEEVNQSLQESNIELSNENNSLKSENQSLKDVLKEKQIPQNTVLVELSKLEKITMDKLCENESRRVNKEITADIILKNTVFEYLTKGAIDFFPRLTNLELKEIHKRFTLNQ